MPDQIMIGNFAKGLITSRLPFVIDNDAFPFLFNFYVWRGRAKRKRGTIFLARLRRNIYSVAVPANPWEVGPLVLVADAGNLISGFSLQSTSSIVPGTLSVIVGANTYTDPGLDGILVGAPAGSGTINYATGAIVIDGGGVGPLTGTFAYYPTLPVMGLRDFEFYLPSGAYVQASALYPLLLAFDTVYSYQINQTGTPFFYNVNYYKGSNVPFVWSGQDYQQFWTTNYSGALWATNNKPGFHFVQGAYSAGSGTADINFVLTKNAVPVNYLVVGDKLWFNEWDTGGSTLNGFTGTVSVIVNAATGTYTVHFDASHVAAGTGIVQLLTNSISGQDGIKWYDGDPTNGSGLPTGTGLGWVNFAPPLTATSVALDNGTPRLYYLVGALAILPFKDRLLFFSPIIQSSTSGTITLQDTVLWSWNGTPYYALPVPQDQTADVTAYYVDQTGKGGYLSAGISQPIITVSNNEDVLLIGFGGNGRKTRFVYTGNDYQPFLFYNINSELPSTATFSSVALDKGAIDIGAYGIAMTDQQSSARVDLDIPDEVFQIRALDNGMPRVNAIRDFFKEWIYFCFPINTVQYADTAICRFPLNTFLFNYRDNTWSILYENFTTHGTFRRLIKKTWTSIGYSTWASWREPWNSGANSPRFPSIIAGNPQGFVLVKGTGTGESISGVVTAIANDGTGLTQITSVDHCVTNNNPGTGTGDYLLFLGILGLLTSTITAITLGTTTVITTANTFTAGQLVTISGVVGTTELNGNTYEILAAAAGSITIDVDSTDFTAYVSGGTVTSAINGLIGKVVRTPTKDTFVVDIPVPAFTTAYLGGGVFKRLSQPFLQTKQFPMYWDQGRKTRLAAQKYLLDTTQDGQLTVNIYLSQDADNPWNDPQSNPPPNSLVYTQLMYTCPESSNIGLTPANTNLQMPTAESQNQIWHRFNTSLIGDSIQIGITLNDAQMRNQTFATSEIGLHGIHLTVEKSQHLA